MPDAYKNLAEIARVNGVSSAAVTGWTKKGSWPGTLDRAKVDEFVRECVAPHRRGKQRQRPPRELQPLSPHPVQRPAPPTPIAQPEPIPPPVASPPDEELASASLEELERRIRSAPNSDVAERLSKQVRALKVIREIQQRDGETIDAAATRAEIKSVLHFFQTTLANFPRAIAMSLEGLRAVEIETVLDGRLTEMLGELKRGLQGAVDSDEKAVEGNTGCARRTGETSTEPDGTEI